MSNISNSKMIAKNTLMLYVRMFLVMGVSLFTSRIVLKSLGVEDYGIYSVVGGVISMFSILSSSLSSAVSRFLAFELGHGDIEKLKRIFSSSIYIIVILIIIVFFLAEIVGVWFLNEKMSIPAERLFSANWVFQFSLFSLLINLLSIPYSACIIAHERMSAFAYIGILDISLKLSVALLLEYSPIDVLIYYGILMCSVSIILRSLYTYYCRKHFEECIFKLKYNKAIIKDMFGYVGWTFWGTGAWLMREQGINILLNIFCGPIINAAKAIADQVYSALYSFVCNFSVALNPQIIKAYASGDKDRMLKLVYIGCKFPYFLYLLLSIPVFFNTEYIVQLWLGEYPEYVTYFIKLLILFSMSEIISRPFATVQSSTGEIRNFELIIGFTQILNIPFSYVLLKMGYSPICVIIVAIIISQCCLYLKFLFVKKILYLSFNKFFFSVYFRIVIVTVITFIVSYLYNCFQYVGFDKFLLSSLLSVVTTLFFIYIFGINKEERNYVHVYIKKIFKNKSVKTFIK